MVFMIVTALSAIDDGSPFFSILMVVTGRGPLPSLNGLFSCTLYRQQNNHIFQAISFSSQHLDCFVCRRCFFIRSRLYSTLRGYLSIAFLRALAITVGTVMAATASFDCSQHPHLTYISMSSKGSMLESGSPFSFTHRHGLLTSSSDLPAEAGKPIPPRTSRIAQTRSRHRLSCNSYRAISTLR